jgi:MFS family permease
MKEQVDASPSSGTPFRTMVLLDVLRNPKVLALGGACFVLFFLFTSIRGTMIPLYGTDTLALTSVQIGLLFSVTSMIIMVMLLFLSHRLERFVRRSVLLPLSLLFCSVSVFLIVFAADFLSFILVLVPLSIGLGILQPLPFAMVGDYAQSKTIGITMGVLRTVGDLGIILGPIIVGWLLDLGHNLYVFYLIAAIVGLFSLVTWVVFIKRTQ